MMLHCQGRSSLVEGPRVADSVIGSFFIQVEPRSQVRVLHVVATPSLSTSVLGISASCRFEEDDLASDVLGAATGLLRVAQGVRHDLS